MPAAFAIPPAVVALGPVYVHVFMVGWVAQFIFGIVYWMFPRYSKEKPRGSETLGWATYGLLNSGLALRTLGEPLHALQPAVGWGWVLALICRGRGVAAKLPHGWRLSCSMGEC
jgi:hypothetical protein